MIGLVLFIPIVIGAFGRVTKGFIMKLEDLEIMIALVRSARILET